jgi:UDP:flavonoid glycosyltransferase YjiC (YdhE family)
VLAKSGLIPDFTRGVYARDVHLLQLSDCTRKLSLKILIASAGIPGHLNPLLTVANILLKHGHDVAVQTSAELKPLVDTAGVPFISEIPEAKTFVGHFLADYPERAQKVPGMEMYGFDLEHGFARMIPVQSAGLELALRDFPADIILADSFYWGTLPMLVGSRDKRPAVVHLGITVLNLGSGKNVPMRPGSSEEERRAERERRERLVLKPAQTAVDTTLAKLGCPPLPCPALESMSLLPDLYLHPGIESFEYPTPLKSSSRVRYIGPLPLPQGEVELPAWWHELDKTKRLVLVTQGTIANRDFSQLIEPTLTGLAKDEDLIVMVTTGGRPVESISMEIPANARVAEFLPFNEIMPSVDLLITNGGYGTVNMALAHGIPIISAGLTEDKEEVSAHVQWAGVGLDLRTNQATPEAVRKAANDIFVNPVYRDRARELAREFTSHNTEEELLSLLAGLSIGRDQARAAL